MKFVDDEMLSKTFDTPGLRRIILYMLRLFSRSSFGRDGRANVRAI
jgi:hypothetical protein